VTVLASRPTGPGRALIASGGPGPEHRPLSVVVVLAGAGALILGVIPFAGLAVLSWLTSTWGGDGGSAPGAIRVGLHLWLSGHHVPVTLAGAPMTVAPLGITVAIVITLVAAGGRIARHALILDWLDAAKAAVGLGGVYGAGLLLTAALTDGPGAHANPVLAFLAGFVLAVLAGGAGLLRRTPQLVGELRVLVPEPVRAGAVGALVAAGAILAGGFVLTVVSLVVHHQRVGALFALYHGGWFSTVVLALVCVALLPNAAVFGAAYLLGPGFAIGTQTLVSPMVVELGKVPALPLLAALPSPGQPPVTMTLAYVISVVAGALGLVAALRYAIRHDDDWRALPIDRAALRGVLTGLAAAVLTTGLILFSGGAWGDGRLSQVGAPAVSTLALAVAWFGLTGAVGATLWWLTGRGTRVRG
jgi:hypothetical protein